MGNSSSLPHSLQFLVINDKRGAQILLDQAEKRDFYLEECHDDKANSLARNNLTYVANSIALQDYNFALSYLEGSKDFIPSRLMNDLGEVKIVQLMPSADGGMPHTRPDNIICYPNISQLFSQTTLIHELWHLHQRKYNDLWLKIFKKLGWTMWNGVIPEKFERARRYNPDTIDCPLWIFNNEWIPIPIFKDITRPNVSEVEIWFYNPSRNYHITRVPESIALYFPNLPSSAYEHPREITAYLLSEPDKYENSNGFKQLLEYIGYTSIMTHQNVYNK
jgi:hypothetical protein